MNDLSSSATSADFEAYIDASKGIIYKVASSYCKDPEDRKDLAQEIIIQLWSSFNRFNHSVKLSTWTYRIALNVAISFYRKDSKRRMMATELSGSLVDIVAESEPSQTEQQLSQLQQFISELKEVERAIMILYLEDRSQKEIGEIMGITQTNISTQVARIKEKIRKRFSLVTH